MCLKMNFVLICYYYTVVIVFTEPVVKLLAFAASLPEESTSCTIGDTLIRQGSCLPIQKCEFAIGNLEAGITPTICSGNKKEIRICCPTEPSVSKMMCNIYRGIPKKRKFIFAFPTVNFGETSNDLECENFLLSSRISGGRSAFAREFPYQIALGYNTGKLSANEVPWKCGGTLISDQFVLTAAHCIRTSFGPPTTVLLGDIYLSPQVENPPHDRIIVPVKAFYVHPNYNPPVVYNDIALVQLSEKVNFSRSIIPACLPQPEDRLDKRENVKVAGWGQLGVSEKQSNTLQCVDLNKISVKSCNKYFENSTDVSKRLPKGIIQSQICAGDFVGIRDTCPGDSGSGLVVTKDLSCDYYVVGVTSFGSRFCGFQQPGVYTKVASYLEWIESVVWPNVSNIKNQNTKNSHKHENELSLLFPGMNPSTYSTTAKTENYLVLKTTTEVLSKLSNEEAIKLHDSSFSSSPKISVLPKETASPTLVEISTTEQTNSFFPSIYKIADNILDNFRLYS